MRTVLIAAVVGMGILIILGIGVMVYGLMQRADNPDFKFFNLSGEAETQDATPITPPTPPLAGAVTGASTGAVPDGPTHPTTTVMHRNPLAAFGDVRLSLPQGYRVVDATLNEQRLLVRLQKGADQTRLMILDATSGSTIGTLDFAPAQ